MYQGVTTYVLARYGVPLVQHSTANELQRQWLKQRHQPRKTRLCQCWFRSTRSHTSLRTVRCQWWSDPACKRKTQRQCLYVHHYTKPTLRPATHSGANRGAVYHVSTIRMLLVTYRHASWVMSMDREEDDRVLPLQLISGGLSHACRTEKQTDQWNSLYLLTTG